MARRATSLGPKPSLFYFICFVFFFCFLFFLLFFFVCFFGGFKGQVRWPKGPPHLALNPPYFICFCFFFFFFCCFFVSLSLLLLEKPCFPPLKRAFLCIFSVCPFVSLLPCFTFSFFFVSLSSSFLFPSFLFLSFLFLVLAFPFCFLCFLLLSCSLVSVVLVLVFFYLES